MPNNWIRRFAFLALSLSGLCSCAAFAQSKTLNAIFTTAPVKVDGYAEPAWSQAPPAKIAICMNAELTAQLNDCKPLGTVMPVYRFLGVPTVTPEPTTPIMAG
jgi:hypothetical protein